MDYIIVYIGTLVLVSIGIAAGYLLRLHTLPPQQSLDRYTTGRNRKVIGEVLKALGCEYKWEKDENGWNVNYDFQEVSFQITLEDNNPYIKITNPFIVTANFEELETVRTLCNQYSRICSPLMLSYNYEDGSDKIHVHISASVLLPAELAYDVLEYTMHAMIEVAKKFAGSYTVAKEISTIEKVRDHEKETVLNSRVRNLVNEVEMKMQEAGTEWRETTDGARITVEQVMMRILRQKNFYPYRLTIYADGMEQHIETNAEAIRNFCLSDVFIQMSEDGSLANSAPTEHTNVVLNLYFGDNRHFDTGRQVVIALRKENVTDVAFYYRITVTAVPMSVDMDVRCGLSDNKCRSHSFMAAIDFTTEEHRKAEFNYMWKEALAKQKDGKTGNMTDAEKLIAQCSDPCVAQNLYRGATLYAHRRPYEALPLLLRAYDSLVKPLSGNSKQFDFEFFETAYLIGSCYFMIGLYDTAHYYLELVLPLHNYLYKCQYVNCLVAGGDFRAVAMIDSLINDMDDEDEESEMTYDQLEFHTFLLRRKATALINVQRYEEAEAILRNMLDEEENIDFAIKEMARLHRMRS